MTAPGPAPRSRTRRTALLRPRAPVLGGVLLIAIVLVAVLLAGNGSTSTVATQSPGDQLTIYSSLPLAGPLSATSQAIANGEKLALAQAGGQVGQFKISYYSLNDARPAATISDPATETWSQGVTSTDAKLAAQDKSTIAYLGDYNSGASAISLPLTNAAGILQISPASSYVGLTSSAYAGQDEPGRFYLTGRRTFARVVPGDLVQGAALVAFMHRRGVHRVLVLNDTDAFAASLGQIVATDAPKAGVAAAAPTTIELGTGSYAGLVAQVKSSGADAVFFSGEPGPGTVNLWRQLSAADPNLMLLGSNVLDQAAFTSQLGPAAHNTYLSTPLLGRDRYPPAAQAVLRAYRQRFGIPAPPVALYGYAAMEEALAAVRGAGAKGNERGAVVQAFFAQHDRDSVLGRYSMLPSGDTTLSAYGIDRVSDQGQPTFAEEIQVTPTPG